MTNNTKTLDDVVGVNTAKKVVMVSTMAYTTFWASVIAAAYAKTSADATDCVKLGCYAVTIGGAYALYNIGKLIKGSK